MVNVSFDDRRTLASILHRVVLQSPEAVAGNLSFIDNGHRESTFISVRNFVPIENSNFSVNSSQSFSPWVVQVRACIMNRPADKSVFEFEFFDENGTSLGPDQSFVVFPSGSTTVPSGKPYRPFRRGDLLFVWLDHVYSVPKPEGMYIVPSTEVFLCSSIQ